MSQAESPELTRALDLLVQQSTEGLDNDQGAEIERLLERHPDLDPLAYDRAAALADLALAPMDGEPLPAHLRARLEESAKEIFGGASRAQSSPRSTPRLRAVPPAPEPSTHDARPSSPPSAPSTSSGLSWTGWIVAAASLIFAAWTGYSASKTAGDPPRVDIAQLEGSVEIPWQAGPSERSGQVSGRVVWNEASDQGYMVFESFDQLANNEREREQYQLWIIDKGRPGSAPVDGGVFDLPAPGETVRVPIDAKLLVREAAAFAVTIEEPGGVVVSEQEHVVALAPIG